MVEIGRNPFVSGKIQRWPLWNAVLLFRYEFYYLYVNYNLTKILRAIDLVLWCYKKTTIEIRNLLNYYFWDMVYVL